MNSMIPIFNISVLLERSRPKTMTRFQQLLRKFDHEHAAAILPNACSQQHLLETMIDSNVCCFYVWGVYPMLSAPLTHLAIVNLPYY